MTQEQQIRQNTQLLNERMSNNMSAKELITYFKRAKIELCCDLIDDEAKDSFCDYYGCLPIRNINDNTWHLIKIG